MRAATRMMLMSEMGRDGPGYEGREGGMKAEYRPENRNEPEGRYAGMNPMIWPGPIYEAGRMIGYDREDGDRRGNVRNEYPEMRYEGARNHSGKEHGGHESQEGGGWAGRFRHHPDERDDSDESEEGDEELDEVKARRWVESMHNADGSKGGIFRPEQAEQYRTAQCPNCDKTEFWAAMNMMYSDYCAVAKKMNVDRPEFYAHMAKAFLMDEDAKDGKLALYAKYIAGK